MNTQVGSTNGVIIIDKHGNIVDDSDYEYGTSEISKILRFDVKEYLAYHDLSELPANVDILDLGLWYTNPGSPTEELYDPPVYEWRELYYEQLNDEQ